MTRPTLLKAREIVKRELRRHGVDPAYISDHNITKAAKAVIADWHNIKAAVKRRAQND
jgi:hypothetical protein